MTSWYNDPSSWDGLPITGSVLRIMPNFPAAINERYAVLDIFDAFTRPKYWTPTGDKENPTFIDYFLLERQEIGQFLDDVDTGINTLITDLDLFLDPLETTHTFTGLSDAANRLTGASTRPNDEVGSLEMWEWYRTIFEGLILVPGQSFVEDYVDGVDGAQNSFTERTGQHNDFATAYAFMLADTPSVSSRPGITHRTDSPFPGSNQWLYAEMIFEFGALLRGSAKSCDIVFWTSAGWSTSVNSVFPSTPFTHAFKFYDGEDNLFATKTPTTNPGPPGSGANTNYQSFSFSATLPVIDGKILIRIAPDLPGSAPFGISSWVFDTLPDTLSFFMGSSGIDLIDCIMTEAEVFDISDDLDYD